MTDSAQWDFNPDGIGHVLNDRRLAVPIYQRSYSWGPQQLDDFWTDLSGAMSAQQSQYFLGNIVLSQEGADSGHVIIDGQQRLATTMILFAAIRNEYDSRGDEEGKRIVQGEYIATGDLRTKRSVPRLRLNSDDDAFFNPLIVGGRDPAELEPIHSSHTLVKEALGFFEKRIESVVDVAGSNWSDALANWVEFLRDAVRVIVVDVPTEADAFLIFETLNDRGADLTIADLLKNYLFRHAGDNLEVVRDGWLRALGALEISAENSVFTTFLRHLWSSKYGATREKDLYASIKERVTTQTQAIELSQELVVASRDYAALLNSEHERWTELGTITEKNLQTLNRLDLEQMRPLLLAVMKHFANREIKRTLKSLVSWGVRGLVVGGIGGGKTERAYSQAAVKIRDGSIKDTDELLSELSPIVPPDDEFRANFAKARINRSRLSRYYLDVLQRIEDGDSEPEFVPNQDEEQVNLEHVLPQNPRAGSWNDFDQDEKKIWPHRLGNMALLKKSENERIGNEEWTVKQPILSSSSLSLTRQAGSESSWDKGVIERRQERMAELAVRAWPREPVS